MTQQQALKYINSENVDSFYPFLQRDIKLLTPRVQQRGLKKGVGNLSSATYKSLKQAGMPIIPQIVNYAIKADKDVIKQIENPTSEQIKLSIQFHPQLVADMDNPSYEDIKNALQSDSVPFLRRMAYNGKIDKIPEQLIRYAINAKGSNIRYIKNPSQDLQILAIDDSPYSIRDIQNPTYRVKKYAIYQNYKVISYINNIDYNLRQIRLKKAPHLFSDIDDAQYLFTDQQLVKLAKVIPNIWYYINQSRVNIPQQVKDIYDEHNKQHVKPNREYGKNQSMTIKQSIKKYIKHTIFQFVEPSMLYNMYTARGLQQYADLKDEQLNFIEYYILNKLKKQYLEQLQYRIIRQCRYFYTASRLSKVQHSSYIFSNFILGQRSKDALLRIGINLQQLTKTIIAINQIYDWQNFKQDIDTVKDRMNAYIDNFVKDQKQKTQKTITSNKFENMLFYLFSTFHLPSPTIIVANRMFKNAGTLNDSWIELRDNVLKDNTFSFLNRCYNIGQHASELQKSDFSRYGIDVFEQKFRLQPLKYVRQYYNNDKLQMKDIINLFNDIPWGQSYGGQKWYVIGKEYQKLKTIQGRGNLQQGIDHINDLVHNTSSILTKFKYSKQLLKALNDKKNAQNIDMLYEYIDDPDLKKKYRQYYNMIEKSEKKQGQQSNQSNDDFKEGQIVKYKRNGKYYIIQDIKEKEDTDWGKFTTVYLMNGPYLKNGVFQVMINSIQKVSWGKLFMLNVEKFMDNYVLLNGKKYKVKQIIFVPGITGQFGIFARFFDNDISAPIQDIRLINDQQQYVDPNPYNQIPKPNQVQQQEEQEVTV